MIIIIIIPCELFYINVSWWPFTGVWVTASLLRSLGLFLVFWPILTMLFFRWSQLILSFPSLPNLYQAFGGRFKCTYYNWLIRPSNSPSPALLLLLLLLLLFIQTTALMKSAWILRRVLESWRDLLSFRSQWKTYLERKSYYL